MTAQASEARGDGPPPEGLWTVTQLAHDLGVTPRAIRFYESKGLISPTRVGANRAYAKRDYVRMTLILRGKRLGFSLKDIKAFLDLYDADPTHRVQLQRLVESLRLRRRELEDQRAALTQTLTELEDLETQALDALKRGADKARGRNAG